jgi:tetratricopeptide (TPR) repeat protein
MSGRFNRYQRPYVDLALALILRRHGENIHANALLTRLLTVDIQRLSSDLRENLPAMQASIEREQEHQRKAANAFERALLAGLVSRENRPSALYLLGELYRRLGREAEAAKWLDAALREPSLSAELREWATEQKEACRAQDRH